MRDLLAADPQRFAKLLREASVALTIFSGLQLLARDARGVGIRVLRRSPIPQVTARATRSCD
jgi:hypothetical protein